MALEAIYAPGGGQHALTSARTDLARAQAEKLHDESRIRRSDLVSVAVTGKVWGELLRELSMSVCSLADRMVPELGLSADQHQRLEAECVGLLERLRAWKPGG